MLEKLRSTISPLILQSFSDSNDGDVGHYYYYFAITLQKNYIKSP